MNIFDVHVNRIPIGGTITQVAYRPGKFFNASLDKASEFNERQSVRLNRPRPRNCFCANRWPYRKADKCFIAENQVIRTGERFGLIRFGSRVDVYLPDDVPVLVAVGQRAVAGETVIADLNVQEDSRIGEIR